MKSFALLIVVVFASTALMAQSACTQFIISNNCITYHQVCNPDDFINACSAGWTPTNGTPEIGKVSVAPPGGKPDSIWEATLVADPTGGEGMYIAYPFIANQDYDITIYYSETPYGYLSLYAANGLSQKQVACQSPPPNIGSSNEMLIGNVTTTGNTISAQFNNWIPGQNYADFWMYSNFTGTSGETFVSTVTEVDICPLCSGLAAPTGLGTTNNNTTLTWGAVAGAGGGYEITVSDLHNGTHEPTQYYSTTSTSLTYCPAGVGDQVSFYVQAKCPNGGINSAASSTYTYTYSGAEPPPTNVNYVWDTSIYAPCLFWTAPNQAATGYDISVEDETTGTGWGLPEISTTSTSSYNLQLSTAVNTYQVTIYSADQCFEGNTPVVYTFTVNPCYPPTITSMSNPGSSELQISFTGPTGGQPVTNFNAKLGALIDNPPMVTTYNNVGTTSPLTFTGLINGSYYEAQMQTVCGSSVSSWVFAPQDIGVYNISTPQKGSLTADQSGADSTTDSRLTVYPVPAADILHVLFNANQAGKGKVSLISEFGNIAEEQPVNLVQGQNTLALPIGQLASGVYFVEIFEGKKAYIRKVIIKN